MYKEDQTRPSSEPSRMSSADRNLSVTPIDMRQREFSSAMRGFDRGEVTAFLVEAAGEFELALKEIDRLRQEIIRLEASLQQYRDVEGSLKTTLMSAQKIADDMRETATKDAERIVREAEGQAELVLQGAQANVDAAQRDIDALWLKRREAEASVEATVSVLQSTLEFIRERERRGRDINVIPHRPPAAQSA